MLGRPGARGGEGCAGGVRRPKWGSIRGGGRLSACRRGRSVHEGAFVKELARLLRYAKPYTPQLIVSVVLMAIAGAMQGLTAVLIRPVFDRVLNPATPDAPVELVSFFHWTLYLQDLVPN